MTSRNWTIKKYLVVSVDLWNFVSTLWILLHRKRDFSFKLNQKWVSSGSCEAPIKLWIIRRKWKRTDVTNCLKIHHEQTNVSTFTRFYTLKKIWNIGNWKERLDVFMFLYLNKSGFYLRNLMSDEALNPGNTENMMSVWTRFSGEF